MEYGIQWNCPKCHKAQNRVCRFKNDEVVNDIKIVQKARKTYLTCLYCRFKIAWKKLESKDRKFVSIQNGKLSGEINIKELR